MSILNNLILTEESYNYITINKDEIIQTLGKLIENPEIEKFLDNQLQNIKNLKFDSIETKKYDYVGGNPTMYNFINSLNTTSLNTTSTEQLINDAVEYLNRTTATNSTTAPFSTSGQSDSRIGELIIFLILFSGLILLPSCVCYWLYDPRRDNRILPNSPEYLRDLSERRRERQRERSVRNIILNVTNYRRRNCINNTRTMYQSLLEGIPENDEENRITNEGGKRKRKRKSKKVKKGNKSKSKRNKK
jgi:hypothetical protein